MTLVRMLPYIIAMAVVTYLIRSLPLLLIKKKITNPFILSFLYYVPYAVLSAMTFPAIFSATGNPVSAGIGLAAAIIVSLIKPNLILVSLSACTGALLTELFLLIL